MRLLLSLLSCLFLTSCGAPSGPAIQKPVGTGEYVGSVYTSKQNKDIESAVFGAPNSKVQLTIFTDYECPACIAFHKKIEEKLWKDYIDTKKITVTFKNYPLTLVHPNAEGDALAALCALSDGKFRDFRNAMYDLEDSKGGKKEVSDSERAEVAKKAGISDVSFEKCVSEAWYQKKLATEMKEWDRLGLSGTPSIYLGDTLLSFSIQNPEEFFGILDAALK